MAENRIIGWDYEQHILQNICEEDEARLIAVYGRRRVGKTYLVKYFFNEKFDFFFTGSFETPMKVQLSILPVDRSFFALFLEIYREEDGVGRTLLDKHQGDGPKRLGWIRLRTGMSASYRSDSSGAWHPGSADECLFMVITKTNRHRWYRMARCTDRFAVVSR